MQIIYNLADVELKAALREWMHSFPPENPVVVVPIFNAYEDVLECLDSLLMTTPATTPVLLLDDASTDERVLKKFFTINLREEFKYVRKLANSGFVGTVNLAFEACSPRDVIILNSDVVVPAGWLERLRAAAYYRSHIATATPLTNHGTIVSVPNRNHPTSELLPGWSLAQVDARIQEKSLQLRPIIPTAIGHCVYFKRLALDAVGYFDESFAPGYGEEVDFSQRAVMQGFIHVLADDLFVYHKGSRSFAGDELARKRKEQVQQAHEELLRQRYPWFHPWKDQVRTDARGPLAIALERARAALLGYRIAIDATCIGGPTTGTQVLTLELIRALAKRYGNQVHLTVIVRDNVLDDQLTEIVPLVSEVISLSQLQKCEPCYFDLVHRPFQIRERDDWWFLQHVARRCVISQLDFIAFANPSYIRDYTAWSNYRHLTQLVLEEADGVAFISTAVADDANQYGCQIPPERSCVMYSGTDHITLTVTTPTSGIEDGRPFILVLGTDFRHKNRLFILKLAQTLIQGYNWVGNIVFAGPKVAWGGSAKEELDFLSAHPELQSRIHYLGAVSEAEKNGLMARADLVLYPSTCEGFGLVPFEAAALGTPTLTTRLTSMGEVLGLDVMYLDTLDPELGAAAVWALLSDPELAQRQVAAIQSRALEFTWDKVAERVWQFYETVLALPPRLHAVEMEQSPLQNLRGNPPWKQKSALVTWRQRLAIGAYIFISAGCKPLMEEVRQYGQWAFRRLRRGK